VLDQIILPCENNSQSFRCISYARLLEAHAKTDRVCGRACYPSNGLHGRYRDKMQAIPAGLQNLKDLVHPCMVLHLPEQYRGLCDRTDVFVMYFPGILLPRDTASQFFYVRSHWLYPIFDVDPIESSWFSLLWCMDSSRNPG
jgi:hypothetical protein